MTKRSKMTAKLKPLDTVSKYSSLYNLTRSGQCDENHIKDEYGDMLPRTGIYQLPEKKVIVFLRMLSQFHKKLEFDQKYLQAKYCQEKIQEISKNEVNRLIINMHQR